MSDFPKLRWPLDIRVEQYQGQRLYVLQCPLGIAPKPLVLHEVAGLILPRFDGSQSIEQIVKQLEPQAIPARLVHELNALLEQQLFLENAAALEAGTRLRMQFKDSPQRAPALAGLTYPDNPEKLRADIQSYLAPHTKLPAVGGKKLLGLMAPHIDYRRGHATYGSAYRHLQDEKPDLIVLLGTSHQYSPHLFHLTAKPFATPLGLVKTAASFVKNLASQYGTARAFADEFLHRKEHSLELQLPFIANLLPDVQIAPILIGSFHSYVERGLRPEHFDEYVTFVEALVSQIQAALASAQKVLILAGVDMAHVGRAFGDEWQLTPERMDEVRDRDKIYLNCLVQQDLEGLFNHVASDRDARRICGFPTMYLVLDTMKRLSLATDAHLFDYRQAVDYERGCAVTFAGLGYYGK
jgi:AmmeMemoRadiSam system protein B